MNDNRMLLGIIGLLIVAVIGLAVDRSNQIASLTDQVNQAQTDADEQTNLVATSVADAELQANNAQTQAAIAATAQEDAVAQADLAATSEAQAMELQDSVVAFEDVNSGMGTEVADLSTQRDDLSAQVDDLSTQVADVSVERDDLLADNESMSTQVVDLTTNNEDLSAQVDDLSTQIAESVPTATPSPEPTIEAETSAEASSDLEFVFTLDVANNAVQIAPDNSSIAVLRDDNVIQVFSAEDGTPQIELSDFDGELSDFIYTSNGRAMAAVVDETGVIVFDAATSATSFEDDYGNPITGYDFSGDGDALIAGTARNIEIALLETSQTQTRQDGVTSLDWSADGSRIVIANGRTVTIFEMSDNTIDSTTNLDTTGVAVVDVAFSPDGAFIVGATVDAELVMISAESGSIVWQTEIDADAIDDIAWSSDSQQVAVVADGDIRIYGVDGSFAVQATMEGANGVAWSADGALLAISSADQVGIVEVASLME